MNESHISSQRLNLDLCPVHSYEGLFDKSIENRKKILEDFKKISDELLNKYKSMLKKYLKNTNFEDIKTKWDGEDTFKWLVPESLFKTKMSFDEILKIVDEMKEIKESYDGRLLAGGVSVLGEKSEFRCNVELLDEYIDSSNPRDPDVEPIFKGLKIWMHAQNLSGYESRKRK